MAPCLAKYTRPLFAGFALWLLSCGSDDNSNRGGSTAGAGKENTNDSTESPTGSTGSKTSWSFTADIAPIIKASCAGTMCHGIGSPYQVLTQEEDKLLSQGSEVWRRLVTTSSAEVMPKPGYGLILSTTAQKKILDYLAQKGVAEPGQQGAKTTSSSPSTTTSPAYVPPSNSVTKLCANVTSDQKAAALTTAFTTVDAIANASCGGTGCHTGALPRGFVGREDQLLSLSYAPGILTNLKTGGMPIGGKTISEQDKALMMAYICARRDL